MNILYDGWPVIYSPDSPAALHLLTILAACPPEVRPVVALPGPPPEWFPAHANLRIISTANSSKDRLAWEQRILPRQAQELKADLVHLLTPTPSLFGKAPSVLSPAEPGDTLPGSRSFAERLRLAMSGGGISRLKALFWPADLPVLDTEYSGLPVEILPAAVHPLFRNRGADSATTGPAWLPETYVLYHGPHEEADLRRLLEIWSWVSGPVGLEYPLLIAGLDEEAKSRLADLLPEYNLSDTIQVLPSLSPAGLAQAYRGCSVLLDPAPIAAWENPIRLALSLGKPIAAAEGTLSEALAGPAAYLAPVKPGGRALGAAVLTLIVEEPIARSLSQAALQRTPDVDLQTFGEALLAAYRKTISN